ncbi:hypothetical protein A2U01_0078352 [Trifolium medium]|uniref:Uncharacterized protein n=1 Tax=Trifolium medium TaxID=97028 RepID=A0A392T7M7_9FABA|nr:hypothetical protein [Trifolium medium]
MISAAIQSLSLPLHSSPSSRKDAIHHPILDPTFLPRLAATTHHDILA